MNRCLSLIPFLVTLLAVLVMSASADEMSSTNYRITTTVMSGGGTPMASTNFRLNGTLASPPQSWNKAWTPTQTTTTC